MFISGNLSTCIDPYSPDLDTFESLLVVDALLTNGNRSNYVYLSRTEMAEENDPELVSGASVIIKDDQGNSTSLYETSKGIYKTDSLMFQGVAGRSYALYIKTVNGEEYESESCYMYQVQNIDSIYITKGEEIIETEPQQGIRINIDSKGESDCRYYRWKYEEWWKFEVPYPKMFNYINDTTVTEFRPVRKTCWANNKSFEIIIESSEAGISRPILFIASEKSDRLMIQYHIRVMQFSISKQEFEFWGRMQKINETGGDIFDKQPFQISGNIHNINKPDEQVLGYFQVSGVKEQSTYITKSQLVDLDLPGYKYDCGKIEVGPLDFYDPNAGGPIPTINEIYLWYSNSYHTFVWPLSFPGANAKLVFVDPLCADCTLRGSLTKPDFWIDMN